MSTTKSGFIRTIDAAAFDAAACDSRRISEKLTDPGRDQCVIGLVQVPALGIPNKPAHTHDFEQAYFVVEGSMTVEIDGVVSQIGPNYLVVFPPNVPHRNWNDGPEPVTYLSVNSPSTTTKDSAVS
ncbi:cupin domain-containing protein [Jatrophihabitans sp. DSM 45814]